MSKIDLNLVTENIRKSGFVLEHEVTDLLRKHQWSVISNRYYVDDVQESAREIDLIAYKTAKAEDVLLYTTLIISCKKSESNAWGLLFRTHVKDDPNIDWYPMKMWSNDKRLKFIVNDTQWVNSLLYDAKKAGLNNNLFEPTGHLFAFQEISKNKHSIQNDTNIFNAVSSLMKAEAYEMGLLERRQKNLALYNFNLLSIVDSELIKLHFQGKIISTSLIEDAKCIFSYIVNKKETSSRIHFCTYLTLEKVLTYYDNLHELNASFFNEHLASFYVNIFKDRKRIDLLKDEFKQRVLTYYNYYYFKNFRVEKNWEHLDFDLVRGSDTLHIELDATADEITFFNNNIQIKRITKNALERIYRYSGDFTFEEQGIPF